MNPAAQLDLERVKAEFSAWRATRSSGKERIPENLWRAAVGLLESYSLSAVSRQLKLKSNYLRKKAEAGGGKLPSESKSKQKFLSLTARQLIANQIEPNNGAELSTQSSAGTCRVVLERADGSRLVLSVPIDRLGIEALVNSFLRL
jgi:hypothetical protein